MYELTDDQKRLLLTLCDTTNRGTLLVGSERQAIAAALAEINRWRGQEAFRSNARNFEVEAIDEIRARESHYRAVASVRGIGPSSQRAWGLREALAILTRDRVVSKARRSP